MAEFLLVASVFILGTVAVGLVRVLLGPGNAERMMAAQLIGSGGIASLLTAGVATGVSAATDLALILALLATFASIAFVKKGTPRSPDAPQATDG